VGSNDSYPAPRNFSKVPKARSFAGFPKSRNPRDSEPTVLTPIVIQTLININIFILAYIIIILLASSKSVTIEICEIKSEKNTRPHETPNAIDPAKRGLERRRIEPTMLDFRPGPKRVLPAHRAG